MGMTDFTNLIKSKGVAKEQHFRCQITPPPMMIQNSMLMSKDLEFYIERVQLPEYALATTTIKDNGLNREVVYDKMYGEIIPTFICDQSMDVKMFFDKWISSIAKNKGGVFAYPKEYTQTNIKIQQLNAQKNPVYEVNINNAYPKVVNDVYLSANGTGYLTFQVQFTYESWDSFNIESKAESAKKSVPIDKISNIMKA